ncbi:MAG: type IV toxin-antitoxin system AbiEi family antitoxin [Opitutae bacterium]
MKNNQRTLSRNEATVVLSLREQGRDTVRAADVIELMGAERSARKVIHSLLRKGWLMRLTPGHYLFLPPERGPENLGENNAIAIASAVTAPCYVGWWAAASYHGFTTQKPASVAVAARRDMPVRVIEGTEIRFIHVASRKFFGYKPYDVYGRSATISTPAKTVVDCLDRPALAGGPTEVVRIVYGASVDTSADEVADAALRMKSTSLVQRLGFVMDLVGWNPSPSARAELKSAIAPSARSVFGQEAPGRGDIGYVAEWGLFVRASRSTLLADVPRSVERIAG